jgi:hypothetical protein
MRIARHARANMCQRRRTERDKTRARQPNAEGERAFGVFVLSAQSATNAYWLRRGAVKSEGKRQEEVGRRSWGEEEPLDFHKKKRFKRQNTGFMV